MATNFKQHKPYKLIINRMQISPNKRIPSLVAKHIRTTCQFLTLPEVACPQKVRFFCRFLFYFLVKMKESLVVRLIFHFFWIIMWRKSRVIAVGRGRAFQKGVNYNDAWLYSCKCLILFPQDQPIGRRDVDQQKIHAVWNSISFFPHRISAQVLVKDLSDYGYYQSVNLVYHVWNTGK